MNILLVLAYLFFIGSMTGWIIEALFRHRFSSDNPEHKWVNPGFCTGPYLPIYGFGLCTLFMLAYFGQVNHLTDSVSSMVVMFIIMAIMMTLIEYVAGIYCLKVLKVKLWDYSDCFGNIQGVICPLFSFFWAILSAFYYFLIHQHVLNGLIWLSNNLSFSFFIGMFFGVFTIDVIHSANIIIKVKKFAEEHQIEIELEKLKLRMVEAAEERKEKYSHLLPYKSSIPFIEHLEFIKEKIRDKK